MRRHFLPVLFGVCLSQRDANGFCLRFPRKADRLGWNRLVLTVQRSVWVWENSPVLGEVLNRFREGDPSSSGKQRLQRNLYRFAVYNLKFCNLVCLS